MSASLRLKLIRSAELEDRQKSTRTEAGNTLAARLSNIGADLLVLSGRQLERYIDDRPLEARHVEAARALRKRLGDAINAYEGAIAAAVELPCDVEGGG